MFLALLILTLISYLFAFDPASFAETAGPIAVALIVFLASFKIDLHGSRIRSAIGLLAAIYAAGAPFLGIMPDGKGRVAMFIAGILTTALNERLQGGASTKAVVSFLCVTALLVSITACGPPSRKTLEQLHGAAVIVVNEVEFNASLPDQLLAERIIDAAQYGIFVDAMAQVKSGAMSLESGLAAALSSEKPSLKQLAPITADIISNLRALRAFADARVQRFLAALEIGLRVLGSYFALQISQARGAGIPDRQLCERVGLRYDKTRLELLATAYDGGKFEEYASAAGV